MSANGKRDPGCGAGKPEAPAHPKGLKGPRALKCYRVSDRSGRQVEIAARSMEGVAAAMLQHPATFPVAVGGVVRIERAAGGQAAYFTRHLTAYVRTLRRGVRWDD